METATRLSLDEISLLVELITDSMQKTSKDLNILLNNDSIPDGEKVYIVQAATKRLTTLSGIVSALSDSI